MATSEFYFMWSYRIEYSDEQIITFIEKFKRKFPTDESLIAEVEKICKKKGPKKCAHCGGFNIIKMPEHRNFKCKDCFLYTWITAGTFFHGVNKLFPWVLAIHMWEARIFISSSRFHRLVGVAQSTALIILKKIATVVQASYEDEKSVIPTSEFGKIYCKRSDETPAQQHPRAEQTRLDARIAREARRAGQQELDEQFEDQEDQEEEEEEEESGREDRNKDALVNDEQSRRSLNSVERAVYDLIGFEQIHHDEIFTALNYPLHEVSAALAILEIYQYAKRLSGDFFVRVDDEELARNQEARNILDASKTSFEAISHFIAVIHHGISRKHIQKYVAEFWCFFDHDNWKRGGLLSACARHKGLTERMVTEDVSPAFVTVPELCLNLPTYF